MSAGNFVLSRYELDGGATIVPVRVQPETLALTDGTVANAAPTGDINLSLRAKTRKGNSEYGIGCRNISISWQTAPPTDYANGTLTIPVLTEAAFAAYDVGDVVTYLDTAAVVVGKKAENLR